ncbi:MAG: 30S ribosomal protein S20 [Deltaproteobacteria bacterium]|nr:30S ribosomal protein S20 [Deltaproteobacteria bacterium]
MANHPSALKRARQNRKRQLRNSAIASSVKTQVKKVLSAVENKNAQEATEQFQKAVSALHKGASKGVIHRNKASRKISRLSRRIQRLTSTPAS